MSIIIIIIIIIVYWKFEDWIMETDRSDRRSSRQTREVGIRKLRGGQPEPIL